MPEILRPGRGRVLVQLDPKKEKIGSIIIPHELRTDVYCGEVIQIGSPQVDYSTGRFTSCQVELGDRVLVRKWEGVELPFPFPEDQVLVKFEDLVARLGDVVVAEYMKRRDVVEDESPDAPAYDPAVEDMKKGVVEFEHRD